MGSDNTDRNKPGIANFSALKTAIVNGEDQLVKELLSHEPMLDIEKSYLIDLAQLNKNHTINVNGYWCCTLGHNYKENVIYHPFWGDSNKIDNALSKYGKGYPYVVF